MTTDSDTPRLYNDLAWLWPMFGSVESYAEECETFIQLLQRYAGIEIRTLLDMGCGGGKHDAHFKQYASLCGIDISDDMLEQARRLNPECTYVQADMRDFSLNDRFDAVFLNDSTMYLTSRDDLLRTFQCAWRHLRPGGSALVCVELTTENFQNNSTQVSTYCEDELEVTFIENDYDPDPNDSRFDFTLVYLIRDQGRQRIETDTHQCGLFTLDTWRETLNEAGFRVYETVSTIGDDELPIFVGVKPELDDSDRTS